MGIRVTANTEAKASLKLYNSIASYRFEQEFGEMKGNTKLNKALETAQKLLADIIKASRK